MSILCATDFSPRDAQGIHTAAALAKKLHDPIDLVHVIEPIDGEMPNLFLDEVHRSSGERLRQEAAILRESGAEVRTHLPVGTVAESLDDFANKEHPRMLVVSAVGRSAPNEWLLGSTAERTAERVHVPTLVVRDSVPLEAWTRGERPLRVLVACDFTMSSRAALCWARKLAEIGPCEIMVARVVWFLDPSARQGGEPPNPEGEIGPESQRILVRNLTDWVEPLIGDLKPEIHCLSGIGRPDFRLIEFAEQNQVDLIITGTRQTHGLQRMRSGSFSRGLLRYSPMNVACVPVAAPEAAPDGHLPAIERVLVATDLSGPADRAISYAYSLVRQGGKVQIVSVAHSGHKREAKELEVRLREHIPATSDELNIETEIVALTAHDVVAAICYQAERFGAHVICVGTRGESGFVANILGSVAQDVASRSHRPVLLVPNLPE